MDYVVGAKYMVAADLERRGFERVAEDIWRRGTHSIRWIGGRDPLRAIDGGGRTMFIRPDAPVGILDVAESRGFDISYEFPDV